MNERRCLFIPLWIVLIGLLSAVGCGGGGVPPTPTGGTATATLNPSPTSIPTPTPTLLAASAATPTPQISPTPLCTDLELEIDYQQVQQVEGLYAELTARGRIPLTVKADYTPPRVEGNGQAEVGGGGHAGNCTWVYTGLLEYDLKGDLLLDRQPPVIALSGKRDARNLAAVGSECYGGLLSPVISEDLALFEIEYRDRATLKYSFTVPTIHGEAVWTLHFRCR